MYLFCEFGLLLAELEKCRSETLPNEIALRIDYCAIFWNLRPLKITAEREISVLGRSGCRPSINVKKVGEGINAVNNSGFFPECNAGVMLQIEARRG